MRVDAQKPIEWRQINQKIQEKLNCNSKVYVYRGIHQALFETCLGLHLRFSHKRKVVAELGFGDHLKKTEVELAKLGVRLRNQFEEGIEKEEQSTLAYIHDLDDSLSAELYDHIETLKGVAPTKMYRIHIAHHLFHIKKTFIQKLTDYDIMVCALNEEYALVFTGEKIVLPTLTVGQLAWNLKRDVANVIELISSDAPTNQSAIQEFEQSLPDGVKPWFDQETAKRIYDRSVVILDGHDGSAMVELLSEELGLKIGEPGAKNALESVSYCRWQNESWFEQAPFYSRTENDLRGMLIIDGQIIDGQFKEAFSKCLQKLKELSS